MRSYRRAERVAATVQRILSGVMGQDLRDPRVSKVVVTRVEMNDDLRLASVYFQLLGLEVQPESTPVKEAVAGLENAKGYLRRELGAELQIKFTPDLRFIFDTSLSTQLRINEILANVLPKDS